MDEFLHSDFARAISEYPGVELKTYGPYMEDVFPQINLMPYRIETTMEDILKIYQPNVILFCTKSRMFKHYVPNKELPPGSCWLPTGWEDVKIPKVMLEEDYFYENWHFTSNIEHIASNSIFITHSEISIKHKNKPMLQLWGDSHIPKILYKPHICIDLGFLYRDSIHGANPILGLYWIIEVNTVENITAKWYPLETSEDAKSFFVKKVGKDDYIFPWYLEHNEEYIKKIINNNLHKD
ncbi:hypothetical protein LCGC14_2028560 [marine sediment metagenome]|uniref:Uncharacterized protein n=1 Tax=marine sediment metagenome TaxID=412755 RepID=A0A0F9EVG0_9ZZZZ